MPSSGGGQRHRSAVQDLIDEQIDQARRLLWRARRRCGRWRWASARTCHICQVDRCSSTAASTRSAVCATQSASADRARSLAGASVPCATIGRRRSRPPSTAAASARQVARCSASDRGSCLASRVSNVACWASCSASTGVGGRPWSRWNWTASSPRRTLMWARRVDQRWFNRGSTPTISRIGRLRRIGAGPFGEPDAESVAEVLLQGGVVGLRRRHLRLEQHPAVNRQPAPVEGLDLVRHRHMGVQIRIAGPAVAMGERGRHQAAHVDLPDPLRPGPGEQRLLLDEPQRILDRGLMGPFDGRRDGRVGDRPQASTPT